MVVWHGAYGAEKNRPDNWLAELYPVMVMATVRQTEQLINGGDKFFANNDCRHNLSLTLSHRMGKSFELSGTFVLNSGKRGTLTTDVMYGGILDEFDSYRIPANMVSSQFDDIVGLIHGARNLTSHLHQKLFRFSTYNGRNGYELPLYHRLDLD